MAERYIFTVSELNQFIKDLLDNVPPLTDLLLRGEISNYKVSPSGHHYFTLKDSQCAVKGQCHEAAVSAGERDAGHCVGAYQRLSERRRIPALLHRAVAGWSR